MKRTYETGIKDDVVFLTGTEVEKTPIRNGYTFCYRCTTREVIQEKLEDRQHIFLGANHSFEPLNEEEWNKWVRMIKAFLTAGKLCSLDIPINYAEDFLESGLTEYENFIPQLRIPLPYVKQWNYNTMLKIDDKGFKATNPGVWCPVCTI